jgi:hypothetical protein
VKELTLNVKNRDEIFIAIETTLKDVATGKVVWSGLVNEKHDRFAGVSGNNKDDIIAYLNLDRIIEIIRTEDEPKPVMMAEFSLTDRQAEAILNMRLRSLRKLEEMELRRERDELLAEKDELEKLLDSPARQRTRLNHDLTNLRKDYAETTLLGRRRTTIAEAAPTPNSHGRDDREGPVTVILSARVDCGAAGSRRWDFLLKEGDGPPMLPRPDYRQTADRLRQRPVYTLCRCSRRAGLCEPIRTMLDIDAGADRPCWLHSARNCWPATSSRLCGGGGRAAETRRGVMTTARR